MIGLEVTGVEGLIRGFKGYEKEAEKAISKAVTDTAKAIESDAKKRLAGQLGSNKHTIHGGAGLLGSIYNRVVDVLEKVVGTNTHYAPYIEFGTGDLVFTNYDFSDEAKATAAQYKGKGIRKVNIRGDSFLNWAAVNQRAKLEKRITDNLNKIKT